MTLGAMRYSPFIVGIDIVYEDIQPRYDPALNRPRAYPIRIFSRQPKHYKTVCHFQFGVNDSHRTCQSFSSALRSQKHLRASP